MQGYLSVLGAINDEDAARPADHWTKKKEPPKAYADPTTQKLAKKAVRKRCGVNDVTVLSGDAL